MILGSLAWTLVSLSSRLLIPPSDCPFPRHSRESRNPSSCDAGPEVLPSPSRASPGASSTTSGSSPRRRPWRGLGHPTSPTPGPTTASQIPPTATNSPTAACRRAPACPSHRQPDLLATLAACPLSVRDSLATQRPRVSVRYFAGRKDGGFNVLPTGTRTAREDK